LGWLSDNDYPLAAIEEVITKTKTADEVYDKYLAEAGRVAMST
jgi:ParB family transcriptional regulator, chromosome partitioning protein